MDYNVARQGRNKPSLDTRVALLTAWADEAMAHTGAKVVIIAADDAVRDSLSLLFEVEGLNAVAYRSVPEFFAGFDPAIHGCIVAEVGTLRRGHPDFPKQVQKLAPGTPILLIGGQDHSLMPLASVKSDAACIFEIPFDSDQMVARVRAVLKDEAS
jgi:FixJ family two-component response regulator